jgi:hypothetical protein
MSRALRKRYGRAHAHEIIARRTTHDGKPVQFWSDGAITVGPETGNEYVAKKVDKDILWAIAGDVALYNARELPRLVKAGRKALTANPRGDIADLRVAMRKNAAVGALIPTANLTDAQRAAILASQKRTQWFDPQTGTLTYAPGFLPGERRQRR